MSLLAENNSIAIDTNVFYHLVDTDAADINHDLHIDDLFTYLVEQGAILLIDDKKMIGAEYKKGLLENNTIFEKYEERGAVKFLEYFIQAEENQKKVELNCNDDLAGKIEDKIPGVGQKTDRVFVYVALKEKSPLVSNDEGDIISKRDELKESISDVRIFTSSEAAKEIPDAG